MLESFEPYFSDYAEAFNRFDVAAIASFYHCPCLMISARGVAPLLTAAAISGNTEGLLAHHREQGYGKAIADAVTTQLQRQSFAVVTVGWHILRADGASLWRFANTYDLIDHGSGWRIAVSTTHEDVA